MTDDHGQWALGSYGNREIRTPTLDQLAKTGVRMAHAFTETPVCSPARANFFTGRIASQHGIHDWLLEQVDEIGQRNWMKDEITLAQILQHAGYETALSGKWHCGQSDCKQDGFDHWFSLGRGQGIHHGKHTYSRDDQPVEISGYKTEIITDHAIQFLKERDEQKPLFLFVGYIGTHSPWEGHPERLVEQYRDNDFCDIPIDTAYPFGRPAGESLPKIEAGADLKEWQAQYYAAVSHIDEQVARILDELDTAGERDNTLVVYTADHGLNCGQHAVWGKGNGTRPLNMLEESIRIPLILNHPGGFTPQQVRDEYVTHCDLFQTVLDCAGVVLPKEMIEERCYPGRSFKAFCTGENTPAWKNEIFGEYGDLRMIRTQTHKLVKRYGPGAPGELIDLEKDPRENVNLLEEPEYQELVSDLTERITGHFAKYEDPDKSGLKVRDLPQHNHREAWRGHT